MAHHKSAIKRTRTNQKANERNRHYRSMMRNALRKVREATDNEVRASSFREAASVLDRLVVKGIVHKKTAARRKSRLSRMISRVETPAASN